MALTTEPTLHHQAAQTAQPVSKTFPFSHPCTAVRTMLNELQQLYSSYWHPPEYIFDPCVSDLLLLSRRQTRNSCCKRSRIECSTTDISCCSAICQIENVLMREDAISFQLCGAFLDLVDPIELAVGYVSSWPYHPQAFTIQDVLFKLGEPPEQAPTADTKA